MPGFFICRHCGKTFRSNPRLKKPQKYCSATACQQVRKNVWDKEKYHSSKSHREKRLQGQKACYRKRPGHIYQADYRSHHPEYANRNRELQKERNRRLREIASSMIVNTDALSLQACIDAVYALMHMTHEGKIVNTDALMVQLRAVTALEACSTQSTG